MPFCTSCIRPEDSSIIAYTKHPAKSIKSLLRRLILKKSSVLAKTQSTIHRIFQRIKGTENNQTKDVISDYDMTVFHDDELDDTQLALFNREWKTIPLWARESQLELSMISQMYFNETPEDIFGPIDLDSVREMVYSLELWNTELPFIYSYYNLPSNFF